MTTFGVLGFLEELVPLSEVLAVYQPYSTAEC